MSLPWFLEFRYPFTPFTIWFHNSEAISSIKAPVTLDHNNWLFCCLYLTMSFLKAKTASYLCVFPVPRTVHVIKQAFNICLLHEWTKVLATWKFSFCPPTSVSLTLSTDIYYPNRDAEKVVGSVRNRLQTLEEEIM